MATLCLRVSVAGSDAVKTMQFDPGLQVFDACRIIRDKVSEASDGAGKGYLGTLPSADDERVTFSCSVVVSRSPIYSDEFSDTTKISVAVAITAIGLTD
jgi:N-terminal or F0 domain of Talin-head FERM